MAELVDPPDDSGFGAVVVGPGVVEGDETAGTYERRPCKPVAAHAVVGVVAVDEEHVDGFAFERGFLSNTGAYTSLAENAKAFSREDAVIFCRKRYNKVGGELSYVPVLSSDILELTEGA